jgi:enoyl-CoA hydratase/carnithine racemase
MNTPNAPELLVEVAHQVATVTLNRPDRLNALTPTLNAQLRHTMAELGREDGVRAIIVTGAGRGFCAGADMALLQDLSQGPSPGGARAPATLGAPINTAAPRELQQHYNFFSAVPQPVIACLNGAAAGVGLVLALFADLRFAAADATLTTGFAQRGLCAEHGAAFALARLVGSGHAADLLLSSRKVSGAEAERIGLVNRALPAAELLPFAQAYAADLAQRCSPLALRLIKQQLQALPLQTMAQSFEEAERLLAQCLRSEDFKEGVAHFVERRAPRFTGR